MKLWLKNLLLVALSSLAPIQAIIVSVGFLIIADTITGIWAAIKRGEAIKSAAMRRTVSKFVIYQLAIISGFVVQKFLLNDLVPIVNIIAGVIGMVELKSVLENAGSIVGQDIFKLILFKLGSQNDKLSEEAKVLLKETEKIEGDK